MTKSSDKQARNVGLGVILFIILIGVIIGFLYWRSSKNINSQNNDSNVAQNNSSSQSNANWKDVDKIGLAKMLTQKGVIFYGAYWCSHCKAQKDTFGTEAMKSITYYECDPQGENPKAKECEAAGITGYPTWIYKGEKKEGAQTLDDLAAWVGYKK